MWFVLFSMRLSTRLDKCHSRIRTIVIRCWRRFFLHSVSIDVKRERYPLVGYEIFFSTHFACPSSEEGHLSIGINDIFHVTDTLSNGQMGYWIATKLNCQLTGLIPNQIR